MPRPPFILCTVRCLGVSLGSEVLILHVRYHPEYASKALRARTPIEVSIDHAGAQVTKTQEPKYALILTEQDKTYRSLRKDTIVPPLRPAYNVK